MGDLQRKLFQKKLKDAEAALGFDFSEDAEEKVTPHQTIKPTDQDSFSSKTSYDEAEL